MGLIYERDEKANVPPPPPPKRDRGGGGTSHNGDSGALADSDNIRVVADCCVLYVGKGIFRWADVELAAADPVPPRALL